jgi:hypothetical protein
MPKARNTKRDNEIVRLHDDKENPMSFREIAKFFNMKSPGGVHEAYNRAKGIKRMRKAVRSKRELSTV